jgi:hypothetical protein
MGKVIQQRHIAAMVLGKMVTREISFVVTTQRGKEKKRKEGRKS